MNQQSFGQKSGRATAAGPDGPSGSSAGTGQPAPATGKPGSRHQAVLGHFTVRDLAVFAATLILFVTSLLPVFLTRFNLWNAGNLFFLGLGIVLPLIVSALFAARRLAPSTKVRIGSLSIDQFASVVASFAVAFFFLSVAGDYHPALLAGLIGSIVLFAATVLGRFIPYFASDFEGRTETPAHVVARESAVPLPKPHTPKAPKEPKPAASGPAQAGAHGAAVTASAAGPAGVAAGSAAAGSGPSASFQPAGSTPGMSPFAPSPQSPEDAKPAPAPQAAEPTPFRAPQPVQDAQPAEETHAAPSAQPAAAEPAAVSSAPEVSEWPAEGDFGPPTQAADVVPPAAVAAADVTPAAETPAATPARQASEPIAATAVHQQVRREEPIGATVDPASRPEESDEQPVHEAFWFAVAQHRTAVDPRTGAPAFVIEPGGWVLALEDRGHEFLVQHTDGRVGVLRDLSNIERG